MRTKTELFSKLTFLLSAGWDARSLSSSRAAASNICQVASPPSVHSFYRLADKSFWPTPHGTFLYLFQLRDDHHSARRSSFEKPRCRRLNRIDGARRRSNFAEYGNTPQIKRRQLGKPVFAKFKLWRHKS
jgi:hypothetical protein